MATMSREEVPDEELEEFGLSRGLEVFQFAVTQHPGPGAEPQDEGPLHMMRRSRQENKALLGVVNRRRLAP